MICCDDGHDKIVYDEHSSRKCPLCQLIAETDQKLDNLESDVSYYQDKAEKAEEEVDSLKEQLADAQAEIEDLKYQSAC